MSRLRSSDARSGGVRRALLALLLLLACWSTAIPGALFADTVRISGLALHVDSITPVDDESVRVVLGGVPRIVAKENLEEAVLRWHLEVPARAALIPLEALERFSREALEHGRTVFAGVAFQAILRRAQPPGEEVYELVESLARFERGAELFIEILRKHPDAVTDGRLGGALIYHAGAADPSRLDKTLPSSLFRFADSIRAELRSRLYRAFERRDSELARRVLSLYETLFGAIDPQHAELTAITERVLAALDAAAAGDSGPLHGLLALGSLERRLVEHLESVLLEEVHRESGTLLTAGKAVPALTVLARVRGERRTPATHELVRRALDALRPGDDAVLTEPDVARLVSLTAANDAAVKEALLRALERAVKFRLANRQIEESDLLFDDLLSLRPDPSRANDWLRYEQAKALADLGMPAAARSRFDRVRTNLPWWTGPALFFRGVYVGREQMLKWFLYGVIAALALIVAARRIRKIRRELARRRALREALEEEESAEELPQGFALASMRMLSPSAQEYRRCLEVFGLDPSADLKSIKTAYRSSIKEVHPDLRTESAEEQERNEERFIFLTRTYERLLELRREIGFGDL